jgi:1-deoxy-D-xylulose-5-phosphate synthase
MLSIPGMTVTAPKDGAEMLALLRLGTEQNEGPWSVRWPRDAVPREVPHLSEIPDVAPHTWEILRNGGDLVYLATGTMVSTAEAAADELLTEGIRATVVNCRFLKPYDRAVFEEMVRSHAVVVTVEEGQVTNGFGAYMSREIDALELANRPRVVTLGIPDRFVEHGSREELLQEIGLDAPSVARAARHALGHDTPVASG